MKNIPYGRGLSECIYCARPIAWLPRSTTGKNIALNLDVITLATVHYDAPTYVLNRAGQAIHARDIHTPPATGYLAHRCEEYLEAQNTPMTLEKDLETWDEQRPLVVTQHYPRRMEGIA